MPVIDDRAVAVIVAAEDVIRLASEFVLTVNTAAPLAAVRDLTDGVLVLAYYADLALNPDLTLETFLAERK